MDEVKEKRILPLVKDISLAVGKHEIRKTEAIMALTIVINAISELIEEEGV